MTWHQAFFQGTTTTGREWSCENRKGTKEKSSKTTTSTQKGHPCRHRQGCLGQGVSYLTDKTIFWASPARGTSLGTVRLLCQQAKTTIRQPFKTILGPKSPASKTMQRQKLNSSGRETMGSLQKNGWVQPRSPSCWAQYKDICYISIRSPLDKTYSKCEVKVPKVQENMMTAEGSSMLSKGTTELGPGNKGFFTHPFLIPKKNGESHFIMNLKPLNQHITCTKFKMTTLK